MRNIEKVAIVTDFEIFVKNEGLKISKEHFLQILKEVGLEEINLLNKDFDPNLAEAIDIVPGIEDNKVVRVAPIIKYMKGWSIAQIISYVKSKNWELEIYLEGEI